jgi:hypothetical protein
MVSYWLKIINFMDIELLDIFDAAVEIFWFFGENFFRDELLDWCDLSWWFCNTFEYLEPCYIVEYASVHYLMKQIRLCWVFLYCKQG